jgi:hypothetical protein
MDNARFSKDVKSQRKGSSFRALPIMGMAALAALTIGFSSANAVASGAVSGGGYMTFAKVSNSEQVFKRNECRKYGGRPVSQYEHELVMRRGRTDQYHYNVLWFGQHQYVTYKIDTTSSISRFFGMTTHSVWLCQF